MKGWEDLEGGIVFKRDYIKDLLKDHTFILLSGQREYKWDKDQFEEFWYDLKDIINDINKESENFYVFHFFGPMFFIPNKSDDKNFYILDGQQRIVTLFIILSLIRDLIEIERNKGKISQEHTEIFGKISDILFKDYEIKKIKRVTLGKNTENLFRMIVTLEKSVSFDIKISTLKKYCKNDSEKKIFKCYDFFLNKIYQNLLEISKIKDNNTKPNEELLFSLLDSERAQIFLNNLYKSVVNYLYILKIIIPSPDLGFEIFETLNQRGTKLEAFELFKNLIFNRLENDLGLKETEELWFGLFDTIEGNFEYFLRHYWLSKYCHISKKKLFRSIRKVTNDMSNKELKEFINDLKEEAEIYSALLNPEHPLWIGKDEIANLIDELSFLRYSQILPLLLTSYKRFIIEEKNSKKFETLLRVLLYFSVRSYTILDRNPNEFERYYSKWAREIREGKIKIGKIIDFIKEENPSYEDIEKKINEMKIVENKKAKYILIKVNDSLERTPLHETWGNTPTLEHVIPQKPDAWWKKYLESKKMKPKNYVNRLGNMTILSKKENNELGNIKYDEKREKYLKMDLPINDKTFNKIKEFDKNSIKEREKIIASVIKDKKLWFID